MGPLQLLLVVGGIAIATSQDAATVKSGLTSLDSNLQDDQRNNKIIAPEGNLRRGQRRLATTHVVGNSVWTGCDSPDFATISQAVAAVSSGDTLDLCRGTFNEAVVIPQGKEIHIEGAGKDNTIISAPHDTRYIVNALSGSTVSLKFLTLDGNNDMAETTTTYPIIAGVVCDECNGDINRVKVVNLNTHTVTNPTPSYGVFARSSSASAANSITVKNVEIVTPTAGGIVVDGAGMTGDVQKNTITGNGSVLFPASGIQISRQARALVKLNTVTNYNSALPTFFLCSGIVALCTTSVTQLDRNTLDFNDIGVSLITTADVDVTANAMEYNTVGIMLELQDATGACPTPFRVRYNSVTNNDILHSVEDGIRTWRPPAVQGSMRDNLVQNNLVDDSGAFNLSIFTGRYNDFLINTLSNAGNSGIYVDGGANCVFDSNIIHGSGQHAILVDSGNSHTFDNNNMALSGVSNVQINGGTNISGNNI